MSEKVGRCQYDSWGERICCKDALPESKDHYCICHEQSDDKDIESFNEEIEKIMKLEFYDFEGFYFPEKFDFEMIYKHLRNKTFDKEVYFSGAIFLGKADFGGVIFKQQAHFVSTIFQEMVSFADAMFEDSVHFENSAFKALVLFQETTFQNAHFEFVMFQGPIYCEGVVFQGDVEFRSTIFWGLARFGGTKFQRTNFEGTIFRGQVSFGNTEFGGVILFQNVEFQSLSRFVNANFQKWVSFRRAVFQEKTNFENTIFQEITSFENVVFKKIIDFRGCEIKEAIDFHDARFYDEFLLTYIKGTPKLDFRDTRFSDMTRIGRETNLKNALFNLSNIELVDFTGAQFPKEIYEEKELKKQKKPWPGDWEEVSSIYRKLKQAHQKHGDYAKAGEFYYREMECKKKALKEKKLSLDWFKSFGYSFLKHSCGYGEKPLRVMRNSLISVLGFAFAYFFTNSINLSGNSVLRNILQSIYFSTITFTTLGYGDIHPINDAGRVLAMSEAVLGAIFIALFIFVFGRKMMR